MPPISPQPVVVPPSIAVLPPSAASPPPAATPYAAPPPPVGPPLPGPTAEASNGLAKPKPWIIRAALAAVALVAARAIDPGLFAPVILLFLIVVPFEKLYPRKKGQPIRRPMLTTDVTFALLGPLLNVVGVAAAIVIGGLSLFWLPGFAFRPLVAMLPPVALPVVAFFLFDFLGYWTHRFAHEVPFLWRFHAVHHSPEHMDWISGFRIHPFDGVLIAPAFFFLLAAGFDVELTGILAILQIVLGLFFHANVRVRWRWLDKLVANPEFHHWHHANESDAIGHNYAPALPIWDLAFGTFFMPKGDRRPTHYGVDEPLPRTLGGLLVHPVRGAVRHRSLLWQPIRAVRAGWRAARVLVGQLWVSARRPTHSIRRVTGPGCSSTNGSLFDPDEAPGRMPVMRF
ncbi:MAG: sterol desaturase family protein [Actinomycetota bacterium]